MVQSIKMKIVAYLAYFAVCVTLYYYAGEYLSNQEQGSIQSILARVFRVSLLFLTGFLVYRELDRRSKKRNK